MKEPGARLELLELSASDPLTLANFYASTFQMQVTQENGRYLCHAAGRTLVFVAGQGGQLQRAQFRFALQQDYVRYCQRLHGCEQVQTDLGISIRDPAGHVLCFLPPTRTAGTPRASAGPTPPARLQHFALQTPEPEKLADFYTQTLGFVVSDRVLDAQEELTAIFMRTDKEHHCLALFRAPTTRFDHFSCEVPSWLALRDWADHMASVGVALAWGIGRHGPGNDTFLMVRDMDGNMGEISSDMEMCHPGRPTGVWPHRPQTLNQWGVAIMRS